MKHGFYTPNFGECGNPLTLLKLARACEDAGWDGFFIWDHLQWPEAEPAVDPWVALAAIAATTERIIMGPLVTPIPRRDIVKLARETVTLDHLSGGRLVLGVGLGWETIPEWSAFGHETDARVRGRMLDEGLQLLDALWRGDPVEHQGHFFQVRCEGFARPTQRPRIPVWVGGSWPAVNPVRRAARWDGFVPISATQMNGGRVLPEDVVVIREHIQASWAAGERPEASGPYEIAVIAADDTVSAAAYREAGATWLISARAPWGRSIDEIVEEISGGPPTV